MHFVRGDALEDAAYYINTEQITPTAKIHCGSKNEANLSTKRIKTVIIGCKILTYRKKTQKTLDLLKILCYDSIWVIWRK